MKTAIACVLAFLCLIAAVRADDAAPVANAPVPSADLQKQYEAYEKCLSDIEDGLLHVKYGFTDLQSIHAGISADATKCNKLLPPEDQEYGEHAVRGITLMTTPVKSNDGVDRGPIQVATGVIGQTGTGASLVLQAQGGIDVPKSSIFALSDGYKINIAGDVLIGSTASGASTMPRGKFVLSGEKGLHLNLDEKNRKMMNDLFSKNDDEKESPLDNPLLAALNGASISQVLQMTFDHDEAMDRPWLGTAAYGLKAELTGDKVGVVAEALGEAGVGQTRDIIRPILRLNLGAEAYVCTSKPFHSDNNLLCANAKLAARLGILDAGFDFGVGGYYEHKFTNESRALVHKVQVATMLNTVNEADWSGGHGTNNAALMLIVK